MADAKSNDLEPKNIEYEQEVLGSILIDDKLIKVAEELIQAKDFYLVAHRKIYTAMLYLYYQNKPIEYAGVTERLKYKGDMDKNGISVDYILELSDSVISTVNYEHKIDKLIDLSQKRALYNTFESIQSKGMEGVAVENIIKQVKDALSDIHIKSNKETERMDEGIDDWFDNLGKPQDPNDIYHWGYRGLDDLICMSRSELYIIAARPSVGKSAYALNIVKNLCLQGKKGLFVTLEMSKKQVMKRLMSNMAKVDNKKLKRNLPLSNDEKERIKVAKEKVKKFDWYLYDNGKMTPEHIMNLSRKMHKENGLDFVVVDYLQLMTTESGKQNRTSEVEEISRSLKLLSQELNIPVIALSQLNRDTAKENKEPNLHDLRSSGSIEQDANSVIMLHKMKEDYQGDVMFMKVLVRKNRDGELGDISVDFLGQYMEFHEKKYDEDLGTFVEIEQTDLEKIKEQEDSDLPF